MSNTQTRLSLKKVQYSASLSEETSAFTADVYFDGKRLAHASNRGCGGSTDIYPYEGQRERLKEAEEYAQTFQDVITMDGKQHDLGKHSVESIVGDLLDEYLAAKDLKRLLKTTVGIVGTKVLQMKAPYSDRTAEHFRRQHPDVVLLNELPFDEALAAFKATQDS